MKKSLILFLLTLFLFTIAGCGTESNDIEETQVSPSIEDDILEDDILTIDSDNWLFYFQNRKDDDVVKFARRFVIAKTDGIATNDFFENFGVFEDGGEIRALLFMHKDNTYYIIENESNLIDSDGYHTDFSVIRRDLLFGEINADFSPFNPDVNIEIPSDDIIARTQTAVDLFSDMLPDFNNKAVSANRFNTAEQMESPIAMLNTSHYAVRNDGFSQITWKIAGDDIYFTVLVLIYEDEDLVGAMMFTSDVEMQ